MSLEVIASAAAGLSLWALPAPSTRVDGTAPFLNQWLVLGTFANTAGTRMDEHPFKVEAARPKPGAVTAGAGWTPFDDRCFSRNYDDYVDLFSYYRALLGKSAAGVAVYAANWIWSPAARTATLRVGADSMFRAFWNGAPVGGSDVGNPQRVTDPPPMPQGFPDGWFRIQRDNAGKDTSAMPVNVRRGWNLLLLKVGNREEGMLGFYARLCDEKGDALPGLVSAASPDGPLAVASSRMEGCAERLPVAFREWPYVKADHPLVAKLAARTPETRQRLNLTLQASGYTLQAAGGKPPYRWSLAAGKLPAGLVLEPTGGISGTVASVARLGKHAFTLRVTDAAGSRAKGALQMTVRERPNRWYERARLHGLIHAPERFAPADWPRLAKLMKRQGYTTGFPISYGNGDWVFRWPSRFEPNAEGAATLGRVKEALEAEGLKFGIYIGNTFAAPQFSYEQVILMLEDVCKRFKPAAIWFDWLAIDHSSLDAVYSMMRTLLPDTVIVVNGFDRPTHGDWDICCVEDYSFVPEKRWGRWPGTLDPILQRVLDTWPKRHALETWRVMLWPYNGRRDLLPDWQDYLRLTISLVGEGRIANLDHSPQTGAFPNTDKETTTSYATSHLLDAHRSMADWAAPEGRPPLTPSYTDVDPAALKPAAWGYAMVSASNPRRVYLHALKTERRKTGLPAEKLSAGPFPMHVERVTWLNAGRAVPFRQEGATLTIDTRGVTADAVSTIFQVDLARAMPRARQAPVPAELPADLKAPGNLAEGKPARLLSLDGSKELVPSSGTAWASNAVDACAGTAAQGAYEWAWTLEVDLQRPTTLGRLKVLFARTWATHYQLALLTEAGEWVTVADGAGAADAWREHKFAPVAATKIRVRGIKPDGENQEGGQMGVAELQAFAR
jgi:hypothetical protein